MSLNPFTNRRKKQEEAVEEKPVSYTHLTLPTKA